MNFVSDRLHHNTVPLVRPTASSPPRLNLSPLDEEEAEAADDDDDDPDGGEKSSDDSSSTSSSSSVGCARGVPLSLDANSVMSAESLDDEDDHQELHDAGYAAGEDEEIGGDDDDDDEDDDKEEEEDDDQDGGDDMEQEEDDDDDELSGILESISEQAQGAAADLPDDADSVGERQLHILGVTEDRQDRDDLLTIPKAKRVLSFNTLTALNNDVGCIRDSPKRQKSMERVDEGGCSAAPPVPLLGFSLGPPALNTQSESFAASAAGIPKCMLAYRKPRESPLISSSDEEAEAQALDRRLGEELVEEPARDETPRDAQQKSPVPLLTPPESPVTIDCDGEKATICEWPSNLAVDSAMVAAINEQWPANLSRSMSQASLNESDSEGAARALPTTFKEEPSTMLTPMLKGISVTSR